MHIPSLLLSKVDIGRLHDRGLLVEAGDAKTDGELTGAYATGVDTVCSEDPESALRMRGA